MIASLLRARDSVTKSVSMFQGNSKSGQIFFSRRYCTQDTQGSSFVTSGQIDLITAPPVLASLDRKLYEKCVESMNSARTKQIHFSTYNYQLVIIKTTNRRSRKASTWIS